MLRAIAINKQASSAYCNYVHVVVNTPNFNPFFENGIKILFHDPSLSFSLSVYLSSWQDNYIHDAYLLLSKSHSLLFQIINYLITFTRWTRALLFKRGKSGHALISFAQHHATRFYLAREFFFNRREFNFSEFKARCDARCNGGTSNQLEE